MKPDLNRIQIAPGVGKRAAFEQRESGILHTPLQAETAFYDCIRQGDVQRLQEKMEQYLNSGFVIGRLSNDSLRQMQYWAVSSITLAARAAMAGGLEEISAYNLSDHYIQCVDNLKSGGEILEFLTEKAVELTLLVSQAHKRLRYSPHVRHSIDYIERHLYEKISVPAVAESCSLSPDYLSAVFKKETGQTLSRYVLLQKLREARRLLENGLSSSNVAYILSFCSESYFIACFKKAYGITPRVFAANPFPLPEETAEN